ncbi:MAG: AmmeMemoRadiSam system protein B [Desulfobacteraceae bacterium]|nr:MAG: AmmeMemoRadiSam system protein B [Desulfobacteraceae bacterium]
MTLKAKSIIFLAAFFLIFYLSTSACLAENIRKPAYAGSFYPSDKAQIEQTIGILTSKAKETPFTAPSGKSLKALILPHAGYIYSGLTAAHASMVLSEKQFSKVILMGPDHRVGFSGCAISDSDIYETPLGPVRLHKDAEKLRLKKELFHLIPVSDKNEHSLEVVLPFLQTYLNKFEIVPIVVGSADYNKIAGAIDPILDDNTFLVASSDLSHYLPYKEAVGRDRETISMILNLEKEKLLKRDNSACGKIPVLTILSLAGKYRWKPVLIHYSNSGDTAGERSRVVGYASIAFYGEPTMENENLSNRLNDKQGQILLKLARKTISDELGIKSRQEQIISASEIAEKDLQRKSGTFVTLKIRNQLRGCIGNLAANETIPEGIKRNAINAAFNDFRFSPLTAKEFDKVEIEISILSEPQPLAYKNGEDLINKLRPGIDGVIIRKGHASATFLPQVWEQLKRPEDFLSHLCTKAGLPSDSWKNSKLEVLTYNVQYFEEEK